MDQREQLLLLLYGKHPHRNWEHPLPPSFSPFSLHQVGLPEGKHAQTAAAAAAAEANKWENTKSEKWSCQNKKNSMQAKQQQQQQQQLWLFFIYWQRVGWEKQKHFTLAGWLVVVPLGMTLFQSNGRREGKRGKSVIFRRKTKGSSICVFYLRKLTHLPDI